MILQASSWALFIGRFHPLLVHLPIGFLLIAAFLEVGRRTGKIAVSESTISFILFWSALGATVACVAGYLLSLGGGYDAELLSDHMWQGIGVAGFAWIAWLVKSERLKRVNPFISKAYIPTFALATLLMLTAGHDGGSLTHGEEYLTQYTPEPFRSLAGMSPATEQITEIKPLTDVNQALVYKDVVQPILQMRCVQCHNESKQKGDLRMDQLALLTKGGKGGPAFIAGKSAESDLIKRCLLPESDDDHMPPKGKPQLTSDQITLLSWWIDQGAPADKKVAELTVSEQVKPVLAALGTANATNAATKSTVSAIDNVKVPAANEQDLNALRKKGLIVNALSQDQNLLEVSAVNAPDFGDKDMALLAPIAQQITWLKLGDTKITDAALKEMPKFKNLNKLHLEHTNVSDAGISQLKTLPLLAYINLVDTKVSDAGLKEAATFKALRSVYVWQSAVTDSAVNEVSKKHSNLMVVNGLNEAAVAQFLKAGDSTTAKAKSAP